MSRTATLPYGTDQIIDAAMARALHADACRGHAIVAQVSIADLTMRVPVDSLGVAIWKPVERDVLQRDCAQCSLVPVCRQLPTTTGVALLWRRLGLVDAVGVPTLRGRIVSFFSQGDGLAIAAALGFARRRRK